MRIVRLVAQDVQTKEKQIFTFNTSREGNLPVTAKGGRLLGYLEFCFTDRVESVMDVEVDFSVCGEAYFLGKYHTEGGVKTLLKKQVDGKWQVVARSKATEYVENLLGENLVEVLGRDYVGNRAVEDFGGDLTKLKKIGLLADVENGIVAAQAQADAIRQNALDKVKDYADNPGEEPSKRLAAIQDQLDAVGEQLQSKNAELAQCHGSAVADSVCDEINKQLASAQEKYNALTEKQADIDVLRASVRLRKDVDALLPKIRQIEAVAKQRDEFQKQRYAATGELEWQENELASINADLEKKNALYAATQDKRSRIESVNAELATIAELYEKNKQLNEQLIDLAERQQRLTSEKVLYAERLATVEKNLAELNRNLGEYSVPSRSVGELLEAVRVDVKIDEVTAQIDKINGEIAVKQSRIAEKENGLVTQLKRFRSVLQLDVAVSPIKAKDTILQVLEAKYSKLEAINTSLEQKLLNLRRAAEDYKYRILQIEQSRSVLIARRDKAVAVKQEEFKREVYLSTQRVYSDDVSGVFAVTANLGDEQIDKLNQAIADRDREKDELTKKAYSLEGAIKEIARHADINAAEMATLAKEKANIINRYNEIIAQNGSEAAFNYVKALSANNGTRYLLETQQEAVRGEVELAQEKKSLEVLKSKVESLKTRLKYLQDTQTGLDTAQNSVDALATSGDKLKEELSGIGEGLQSGYEQYKALTKQMESVESRLEDVRASIVEFSKTVKVNEDLIAQANKRAIGYAGSEDIEQAVQNFKYELGDVESERQMLLDSKQNAEKELFKRRLALEKIQWLYDSKCAEYAELNQDLKLELTVCGLSVEDLAKVNLNESAESGAKLVADYDAAKKALAEKINALYAIIKDRQVEDVADADKLQAEIDELQSKKAQLEAEKQNCLQIQTVATAAKVKATAAAAEVNVLDSVETVLSNNKIVRLLIEDKVSSIVALATKYAAVLVGSEYALVADGYKVGAKIDGEIVPYANLNSKVKAAVYVALQLAGTDAPDGRWLVFEDRLGLDKAVLGKLLSEVGNVSYVVDYARQLENTK